MFSIDGFWGPVVGFYGGIVYGFGYFGHGYYGGRWDHGHFFYNTTVNHVDINIIHNVYNERVNEPTNVTRVAYNGGNGGINERPTPEEEAAAHARHIPPVAAQTQHRQAARSEPQLRASMNHGAPPIAATPKPGALSDSGVVRAREAGGSYNATARPGNAGGRAENAGSRPAVHPNDLPAMERPAAPNTGNAKQDQKYQQQQERQKLQQQQDKEHQQIQKQQADEARTQQMEQRHQQQTQQLQERHTQQMQQLQQRQAPAAAPRPSGGGRPR